MPHYTWRRSLAWIILETTFLTLTILFVRYELYAPPRQLDWRGVVTFLLLCLTLGLPHCLLHYPWFSRSQYRGGKDCGIADMIMGTLTGLITAFCLLPLGADGWMFTCVTLPLLVLFYYLMLTPSDTTWNPRWSGTNALATTVASVATLAIVYGLRAATNSPWTWTIGSITFGFVYTCIITVLFTWATQYKR